MTPNATDPSAMPVLQNGDNLQSPPWAAAEVRRCLNLERELSRRVLDSMPNACAADVAWCPVAPDAADVVRRRLQLGSQLRCMRAGASHCCAS